MSAACDQVGSPIAATIVPAADVENPSPTTKTHNEHNNKPRERRRVDIRAADADKAVKAIQTTKRLHNGAARNRSAAHEPRARHAKAPAALPNAASPRRGPLTRASRSSGVSKGVSRFIDQARQRTSLSLS